MVVRVKVDRAISVADFKETEPNIGRSILVQLNAFRTKVIRRLDNLMGGHNVSMEIDLSQAQGLMGNNRTHFVHSVAMRCMNEHNAPLEALSVDIAESLGIGRGCADQHLLRLSLPKIDGTVPFGIGGPKRGGIV
jgi:nitrogen fixation/metabolism regulation signal transduction histidine kinase